MFFDAYVSKTEAVTEKVLFTTWKKLKDDELRLVQEVKMENIIFSENTSQENQDSTSGSQKKLKDLSFEDSYFDSNVEPIELLDMSIKPDQELIQVLSSEGSIIQISVPVVDISNLDISIDNSSVLSESVAGIDEAHVNLEMTLANEAKFICNLDNSKEMMNFQYDAENKAESKVNEFSRTHLDKENDISDVPSSTCTKSPDCDKVKTNETALKEICNQDSNIIIAQSGNVSEDKSILSSLVNAQGKGTLDIIWKKHLHYPSVEKCQKHKKMLTPFMLLLLSSGKRKRMKKAGWPNKKN